MQTCIPPPARCVAVLGITAALASCTKYEAKPLDLPQHRDRWLARSPADEPVRAFAARLTESGDEEAATFDPEDGLSRTEAELVALVYNPDLRLARLRAGVATATAEHAGRWDDPKFAIDVLRITENISSPWVITPSLAFTIPISGRLEVEKQRADAAVRAELDQVAEDEWRIRFEVRVAWLDWSAARLRVEETERFIASMDSLVTSTSRLAQAGEMSKTEATLFAIEQIQQRYELHRLRADVEVAEQHIRALLGLAPDAPITLGLSLDVGTLPSGSGNGNGGDGPDAVAARNLTLARLRQEYEVAEQTLRREIRKQYPDLTIGPMYESDQDQSRIGFLGAIPLPILNANKQGIAEAESERELARAAFETQYERTVAALAESTARAEAFRAQREQIVTEMAPLVDRQLEDARRLLELGEGARLVLLESLARSLGTKMQLVEVRHDESLAIVHATHLIGPNQKKREAVESPTDADPEATK